MKQKLFGTDGIRGLANVFPMTSAVAMQVGAATASVLLNRNGGEKRTHYPHPRIIIGKDTRVSGYMLEQALASGICSKGADVLLVGPLPTPAIAFLVQSMRADAGIMISASHNSYEDNGIKIFDHEGYKLPDAIEAQIESIVCEALRDSDLKEEKSITHGDIGRAVRIDDAPGRYIVSLKNTLSKHFHLHNIPIVVDCAHGAAYKVAPGLLKELGAKVHKIGVKPDGININNASGALHPEKAAGAVLEFGAKIGISLDGDADRVILSDEKGNIVDGDQIMGICALQLKKNGQLANNTVVSTPMSNIGLEIMLKKNGIKLERVPVGDRYVVECMRKHKHNFGGEQSGHILFGDYSTTGDGLLAALKVLEMMQSENKPLSELKEVVQLMPQVREDVRVSRKEDFKKLPEVMELIVAAEKKFADRGRVFIRYSGTEPLVRVMIEGEDKVEIQKECRKIAEAFHKAIGE